jgi:putative endonuclease
MFKLPFLQRSSGQSLGQWGEEKACDYYRKLGWEVLDRNYYNRRGKQLGEIDFVAKKGDQLAFVEVKTRTSRTFGAPAEAVSVYKQRRLVRACQHYMAQHPKLASCCVYRIDVAEVETDLDRKAASVTLLENAVEDYQ